jgi:predicted metal-dependent hydrolase
MSLKPKTHSEAQPTIDIDGRAVALRLVQNRRAKRLILKVEHSTGDVVVVGPSAHSLKQAEKFARKESRWIAEALAKVPQRQSFTPGAKFPLRGVETTIVHAPAARFGVRHEEALQVLFVSGEIEFVPRRVQDWLRAQARTDLLTHTAKFTRALRLAMPKVTVRDTTTRWGSCSHSGRLSFSWRLILAAPEILTYVAAHEVAHLIHMNHSTAFWAEVKGLVGDYRHSEEWLTREGSRLHRFGVI